MRLTRTTLATAAVLALLGGLTACGDDSDSGGGGGDGDDFATMPAADIVAAAQKDMLALDNVHVGGTVMSDGTEVTLDLTISGSGDCQGTFAMGDGEAEIISVDGKTWLKPNEEFWKAQAADAADQIISLVGDKYVLFPADAEGEEGLGDVCNLENIVEGDDDEKDQEYEVEGTDEVDGEDVVLVKRTNGDDPGGVASILTGDDHWIVRIENEEEGSQGSIDFTDFNGDFSPEAPADDDVVDLSQLGG